MQIGLWIDDSRPFPALADAVREAAALGYATAWFGDRGAWDPLTAVAALAPAVDGIAFGTAVVPTWPRHPLATAAQALTAQAAAGGRLTLGVGPSHRPLVEARYGYRWERPARHVEEYLDVLAPALRGAAVDVRATTVAAAGRVDVPGVPPPGLLLAAHGPRLLRLAGERTDGVITTWTTARGVATRIAPAVPAGARIVLAVVASLTADPDGTRQHVAATLGPAGRLPSYRRAMDRDGLAGPADTVLAGDEAHLGRAVRELADAGVTDLQLCPLGLPADRERTVRFFADLARSAGR